MHPIKFLTKESQNGKKKEKLNLKKTKEFCLKIGLYIIHLNNAHVSAFLSELCVINNLPIKVFGMFYVDETRWHSFKR